MIFLQGFGFDFGGLQDIIDGLLEDFLAMLLAILQFIWTVLVFVANYLWAALNWLANFFYTLFQDVQKALKWLWQQVVKTIMTRLPNLLKNYRQWMHDHLQSVIDFFTKLRKWYDDFFKNWIKPILNMIGIMRKILTIFRLLGFKWAARLDGDLAMIEQKIVQTYTTLRGYINQAITWIDLIVDPTGILRRNPLFAAIFQSANEMRNVLLTVPTRPLTGSETDMQSANRQSMTLAGQEANFTNYYSQGQVTPSDDQARTDVAAYMDAILNGTSLPGQRPNGF